MRGILVVNPKATTTSARTRDVLAGALRSEMELTLGYTRRRGHGFDLAKQAAESGADVVVALGGDGTVNEVVNGLMSAQVEQRPALAVVPGGSTNVFVRALGLPNTPMEAAGALLHALRSGSSRWIGLGRADERYFTFCAGLGIDAAVVRRVEQARRKGRRSTPALYFRSMLSEFVVEASQRRAEITLEQPGEEPVDGLVNVIVQNTAPWTYLGARSIQASPQASFDTGLDLLALTSLPAPSTFRTLTRMLSSTQADPTGHDDGPYGKKVMVCHDLAEFTIQCASPQALQLDGDYLGEREKVRFVSVPRALRVIC
jgi:diacylglycerol kinase family enzyme